MTDLHMLFEEGRRHERGGNLDHALECYRRVLDTAQDAPLIASVLTRISHAHRKLSCWDEALAAARRGAEVASAHRLSAECALAVNAQAAVHHSRGEYEEARRLYREVLDLTEDPSVRGRALQNLAVLAALAGDLYQAEAELLNASKAFGQAGDDAGEAFVLNNYTALALDRAEYREAERRARLALEAARRVGDLEVLGHARLNYAEALFGLGRAGEADTEATAALGFFEGAGNRWRRLLALRLLGDMSRSTDPAIARRFYERALEDALRIGARADVQQLEERLRDLD